MNSFILWFALALPQSPDIALENEYVLVNRNAARCAAAGPNCQHRVIVALADVTLQSGGNERRLRRGDIAVFKPGESYAAPTGVFFEVVLKPGHPPLPVPAEHIPAEKNVVRHDSDQFFIFEERLAVGETRERHSHRPRVVIQLNRTKLQQWPDGQPEVVRDIIPDQAGFNPPVIHKVTNVGELPLRGIVIELKANAPPRESQALPRGAQESPRDARLRRIHDRFVFADIHAHPSAFHRANVERIDQEEIARYKRGLMDLVVANVSSDAAYQGGVTNRDGTRVARLNDNQVHPTKPGEPFAFTVDRFERILKTIESGDAVLASSPDVVLRAKREGKLAIMPALEGADGLEGNLENLRVLHRRGLRLLQIMHFLDNNLGSNQIPPYEDRGLSDLGKDMIREANRLGIIVDLAHANTRTIMDALATSSQPIVFSHTGAKALHQGDRYLTDDEIRAIAAKGGLVGIWPTAVFRDIPGMVKHIDHVKKLVGIDHISIASDLRGMSYLPAFGEEANFRAIAEGLIDTGYSDDDIGKVMGANFFRLWQQVSRAAR